MPIVSSQGARPQFSVDTCVARDAWSHGAALSRWEHEYERVRPGRFSGHVRTAWLGPIQLVHESIDHAFNYRGTPWRNSRVFFSYLPGCGEVFYDNRPVGTSALVTHRWDAVERVNASDRINLVIAAIDEGFLREYLASVPGLEEAVRSPNPACYTADPASITGFQRTVYGILDELVSSPQTLASEMQRAGLQQRVLDAIVTVIANSSGSGGRLPAPSTRAYIVGRAIEFMEGHLGDPVSIRDVCAAIRVCPRTLSYAFATVLGASPKSYLMATRLDRTFRDLADARVTSSIENVAARWGFSHMGRFAKYYRTAYGERPSDTYRRRGARTAMRRAERAIGLAARRPRPALAGPVADT